MPTSSRPSCCRRRRARRGGRGACVVVPPALPVMETASSLCGVRRRRALCAFFAYLTVVCSLVVSRRRRGRCAVLVLVHTAVPALIDAGKAAGVRGQLREVLNAPRASLDELSGRCARKTAFLAMLAACKTLESQIQDFTCFYRNDRGGEQPQGVVWTRATGRTS